MVNGGRSMWRGTAAQQRRRWSRLCSQDRRSLGAPCGAGAERRHALPALDLLCRRPWLVICLLSSAGIGKGRARRALPLLVGRGPWRLLAAVGGGGGPRCLTALDGGRQRRRQAGQKAALLAGYGAGLVAKGPLDDGENVAIQQARRVALAQRPAVEDGAVHARVVQGGLGRRWMCWPRASGAGRGDDGWALSHCIPRPRCS